jgi:transcriptional regulator with XRE-family HTH domain
VELRTEIKVAGITQRKLARLVGIREESISRFVHGHLRPSPETRQKIAAALGRRVSDLSFEGRRP